MTEFSFYYLTYSPVEKILPKLVEKIYDSGKKCLIYTPLPNYIQKIDAILWSYSTKTFIPHGTNLDEYAKEQPIYITNRVNDNANCSNIIMLVNCKDWHDELHLDLINLNNFEKCIYIFDSTDENEFARAKKIFQYIYTKNIPYKLWKQDEKTSWCSINEF